MNKSKIVIPKETIVGAFGTTTAGRGAGAARKAAATDGGRLNGLSLNCTKLYFFENLPVVSMVAPFFG